MIDDQDKVLHREIRKALNRFHDLPYLRKHCLTRWLSPHLALGRDRGQSVQQWLQEAVEQLKPVRTPPERTKEWRPYFVLYYRYIEGLRRWEVMDKLGISESEFHRQQKNAIAAVADYLKQARAETRPPPVAVEPIPRIERFAGRQEELAYYRRWLERENFCVVSGMAGVGKTSLGAELACQWKERGHVVWFRFCEGRNTDLEAVLERLALSLAALGRDEYWRFLQVERRRELPLSQETRVRYLINVLAGENYTLCFDNFELVGDDAMVNSLFRDLLSSAQAGTLRLLVMSRVTPAFATGYPARPLGGLCREDARLLLAAAGLPLLPETIFTRLYEKTGGVPVFLKLFATWMHGQKPALSPVEGPALSETKGLPNLDDDRARGQVETFVNHLVRQRDVRRYLLREVYGSLSPVEQRLLEVVSAFRLPLDEKDERILRLLAAEGIEDVGGTLDSLADRHLFTLVEAGDYHLHPLVREYCSARLAARPADKTQVHSRLAGYCEERNDPLEAAYHHGQAGEHRCAATLLTANLQRLVDAGQGQAALKQLEQLAPRLVDEVLRFELVAARERLYDLLGRREQQRAALSSMLALAEDLDDDRRLAATHNRCTWFHEVTGDYGAAVEAAQRGQAAARRAGDRQAEAESLTRWRWALFWRGEYAAAREQARKALQWARMAGDRETEADCLNTLGTICWALGDHEAAEGHYQQVLTIRSALGDQQYQAASLNNLGIVYRALGDCGVALSYYEQSLAIKRAIGDRRGEASTLVNLTDVYCSLGDYETGRDYCEQALAISRAIGERRIEASTLINLGIFHCHLGDYAAAQDYSRQAVDITRAIGARREGGHALTYLGTALEGLGDLAAAQAAYIEALAIRREIGQQALTVDSLAGLGRVALAQGDRPQAKARVEECLAHIAAHGVDGIEYPILVYHTCARILEACGEHDRARETLKAGYDLLREQAEKISDPTLRRSFLENVPAHRETVRQYESALSNALDRS